MWGWWGGTNRPPKASGRGGVREALPGQPLGNPPLTTSAAALTLALALALTPTLAPTLTLTLALALALALTLALALEALQQEDERGVAALPIPSNVIHDRLHPGPPLPFEHSLVVRKDGGCRRAWRFLRLEVA